MTNDLIEYPPHIHREQAHKNTQAEFTDYSKRDWDMRILFVDEYVKDWNPVLAAMRCGFDKEAAQQISGEWLDEPAVQKLVEEYRCPQWLARGHTEAQRQILSLLWREANFFGFGSTPGSRIAATKQIGTYLKMEPVHQELKMPELLNGEAFHALPVEEQRAFIITLRKLAPAAKAVK